MKRKTRIENMQKKKPKPVSVTVPGVVNSQNNTIEFKLTDCTRLLVYRSAAGQWLATIQGITPV
ncbi:MAG: hypothetical protein ABI690_13505 [Chloroflexota bacterium]